MKIQFKRDCWLVVQLGGGFDGYYNSKALLVKGKVPFDVVSVVPCGRRISDIHVWTDGLCDGQNEFLRDVPNELFESVKDE